MSLRVAIPGGTGLIGRRLVRALLERGHEPVVLTRSPEKAREHFPDIEVRPWVPHYPEGGCSSFEGADAVVNLAGEPIGTGRWTAARKERIRGSRVDATRGVVQCLSRLETRPNVFVVGSAVGYYGCRGDHLFHEDSPAGTDFLAAVCRALEQEAAEAGSLGVRVVRLRTGVVLSSEGGALPRMTRPFRLGLGARLGDGSQWFSWIHIEDVANLIVKCLESPEFTGAVNAVSPNPVTNAEFTRVLAEVLARPGLLRVPAPVLRMLAGEVADALLCSQRAVPDSALRCSFEFRFSDLRAALSDCLHTGRSG